MERKIPEPIEYKEIKRYVFEEKRNIFLTGLGGTGKSQALLCIKRDCELKGIICYTTSTTGISGYNIRGQTIHRFSGIGIADKGIEIILRKISKNKDCIKRLKDCQILILDEISMLGLNTFTIIDKVLKHFRKNKLPFGGVQLVLTGDFLKLPPIVDEYCFESDLWEKFNLKIIKMNRPYRYKSKKHFEMLKRIRLGKHTKEDVKILETRVKAFKEYEKVIQDPVKCIQEYSRINKNICKIISKYVNFESIVKPVRLYSTKVDVNTFNKNELDKLPGKEHIFIATDNAVSIKNGEELDIEDLKYHKEYMDTFISNKIILKENAQVILTKNLDVESGLSNGSSGIILSITYGEINENKNPIIKVQFKHGITENITIEEFVNEDNKIKYIRKQIPLILGFASTIHRSQGMTLDYAIIDLGNTLFQEALGYVAISRLKTLDGILIMKLMATKIKANKRALEFEESIEDE
jgi:ATP-dependent DNA helicase PIF1